MHSEFDQVLYYSLFHPLFLLLLLLLSSLSPGVDWWGAGLYFPTGFARAGPVAGFQGDTLLLAFSDLRQVGLCLRRGPLSFGFFFFPVTVFFFFFTSPLSFFQPPPPPPPPLFVLFPFLLSSLPLPSVVLLHFPLIVPLIIFDSFFLPSVCFMSRPYNLSLHFYGPLLCECFLFFASPSQ